MAKCIDGPLAWQETKREAPSTTRQLWTGELFLLRLLGALTQPFVTGVRFRRGFHQQQRLLRPVLRFRNSS